MQPAATLTSLPRPPSSPSRQREREREVVMSSPLHCCPSQRYRTPPQSPSCMWSKMQKSRWRTTSLRWWPGWRRQGGSGLERLPWQHQHQHLHLRVQLESIMIPQLRVYYTLHSPFPTFFTSMCRSWWARTSLRTESSTPLRRRSSKPVCFRSANAEGSLRTKTTRSRGRPTKLLEGTERGCFTFLSLSK